MIPGLSSLRLKSHPPVPSAFRVLNGLDLAKHELAQGTGHRNTRAKRALKGQHSTWAAPPFQGSRLRSGPKILAPLSATLRCRHDREFDAGHLDRRRLTEPPRSSSRSSLWTGAPRGATTDPSGGRFRESRTFGKARPSSLCTGPLGSPYQSIVFPEISSGPRARSFCESVEKNTRGTRSVVAPTARRGWRSLGASDTVNR
jgi:hypothetical protein